MASSELSARMLGCVLRTDAWAKRQAHKAEFGSDRAGLCALASARLCAELELAGFQPAVRVVHSARLSGHCFVECEGWLLDVTATQFGLSALEVHPMRRRPRKHFWMRGIVCRSLTELHEALVRHRWPRVQIPGVAV